MKIYNLQITQNNGCVKLSVSVESGRLGLKELWFSTPVKYGEYLCKARMDGFLVGMLFAAMQYGEDIHINGCVSKKLLFNLNNYVVPLLLAFSPSCTKIKITADETSSERLNSHGVGTGFTGGVDSFCTMYDRFELEVAPEYRINSVLFLNIGHHGWGGQKEQFETGRRKFLARYDYLKRFADEIGLDFIPLDSNLNAFHPWGPQKAHTLTSAAGVLVLQANYSKYYYSSAGLNYDDMLTNASRYKEFDVAGYCDPLLLPLLSTESLELISDGCQYSRVEKILHIINYEPVRRYLNVCVADEYAVENCSECPKCCRTLMTLNSIGQLEKFRHVFDVDKYKKKAEAKYVRKQVLLLNKDSFARGNIELAKRNGVKIPNFIICYIEGKAYCLKGLIIKSLTKILKSALSPSMFRRIKGVMKKSRG